MRLLGTFPSHLNSFYYDQLLNLVNSEVLVGGYFGGSSFDASQVTALQALGKDFLSLSLPSAGDRSAADAINSPLGLLRARYDALSSEVSFMVDTIQGLSNDLRNEVSLLDSILAYSGSKLWSSRLAQMGSATSFSWSFEGGYNSVSVDISSSDPHTGLLYPSLPRIETILDCVDGLVYGGLRAPCVPRVFLPKNLTWNYSTMGQSETAYGQDWADLGILESAPRLVFTPTPTVQPERAAALFQVSGSVPGGSVPIYVNLHFVARTTVQTLVVTPGQVVPLSKFRLEEENTSVVSKTQSYVYGVDFTVTKDGYLTSLTLPAGIELDVHFEEYYPAYQCSVNQEVWSPVIMLDAARPYPDETTEFRALGIVNGNFPLTDETGVLTGLTMQLRGLPANEMIFIVSTPASSDYGMPATLQVDMARPAYMTGVSLTPYCSYPMRLTSVTCQSVTGPPTILFTGSVLVDKAMTIAFPRTSVRSLNLSFVQENYTDKQYTVDSPDQLRRDTLSRLQSVLPFSVQALTPSVPTVYHGAQYQFGVESIQGVDSSMASPLGILVTGPYRVAGRPEAMRLDLAEIGTSEVWSYAKSYSAEGAVLSSDLVETLLTPGLAVPVPTAFSLDRATIAYTDFYLKFILRTTSTVVSNFYFQVTHV